MRYQIKEALDKFIDVTSAEPSKVSVISANPNDIRLAYTDDEQRKFEFKYSSGQLFLLDDVEKSWFPLDEFNCTCDELYFVNS